MDAARQITSIMLSRRLQFLRYSRHVAVLPNSVGAADCQAAVIGDDTHRLGECSEVSVEGAVVVAHDDRLARLISGNDQADSQFGKQCGQIRSVHAV